MRQTCIWTIILGMVLWTACSSPDAVEADSNATSVTSTATTTTNEASNTTTTPQNAKKTPDSGPGSGASTWAGVETTDVQLSDPYAFVENKPVTEDASNDESSVDNTTSNTKEVEMNAQENTSNLADAETTSNKSETNLPASTDVVWLTDFDAAKAQAKREGKVLFLFFTGSDWCGWCMRLQKEVLTQPEFAAWANEKAVLVDLDFPRNVAQSDELKQQNQALAKQYNIGGYPTVVLTTADGTVIAQTGYREGGAAAYVEFLRTLVP